MKDKFGEEIAIGDDVFVYDTNTNQSFTGTIVSFYMMSVCVKNCRTQVSNWVYLNQVSKVLYIENKVCDPSGDTTCCGGCVKELPCVVCGKNNDVGVKSCWNCGTRISDIVGDDRLK